MRWKALFAISLLLLVCACTPAPQGVAEAQLKPIVEALKRALLDDVPPSREVLATLLHELALAEKPTGLRARVLLYALHRHRALLTQKQQRVLMLQAGRVLTPAMAANLAETGKPPHLAYHLLTYANGTDVPALAPGDSALVADLDLLSSPLFLPFDENRAKRYWTMASPPSRTDRYVAEIRIDSEKFAKAEGPPVDEVLLLSDSDRVALRALLEKPFGLAEQASYLLKDIVDIEPRPLPSQLVGLPDPSLALIPSDQRLARLAIAACSPEDQAENVQLSPNNRRVILARLASVGAKQVKIENIGCAGSALLVMGKLGLAKPVPLMVALSPSLNGSHAGVVFAGFSDTLSVQAIGVKTNQGLFLAQQANGSGGFLDAILIDTQRGKAVLSASQVPDGELIHMLPTERGPAHVVIRQSALTAPNMRCNGCAKNTMTVMLMLDRADGLYKTVNVKISHRAQDMYRVGVMHIAQYPSVARYATCLNRPESEQLECQASPLAAAAEADARLNMGDAQGAARVYRDTNRKFHAALAHSNSKDERALLLSNLLQEGTALLMSGQYLQLKALCDTLQGAAWVRDIDADAEKAKQVTCANHLGLAQRSLGNYAAASEQFKRATHIAPDDPAPLGNLIRSYFDGAQYRLAMTLLLEGLFSVDGDEKFSHYQNFAFAQAASALHGGAANLLFLLPGEPIHTRLLGISLAQGAIFAQAASLPDATVALADESMHYLGQHALDEIGPDILIAYARARAQLGFPTEATFLLKELITPDSAALPESQARAFLVLSEIAESAGDTKLALSTVAQALQRLQSSMPNLDDRGRYYASVLGANRNIVERWFRLAAENGEPFGEMYRQSQYWKSSDVADRSSNAPLPQAEPGELFVDFLKVGNQVWRFDVAHGLPVKRHLLSLSYDSLMTELELLQPGAAVGWPDWSGRYGVSTKRKRMDALSRVLLEGAPIQGMRRLFVTPDIGLARFPWIAITDADGRWLFDRTNIALYIPSADAAGAVHGPLGAGQLGVLASAGSVRAAETYSALPALPGVVDELATLQQSWPSSSIAVKTDVSAYDGQKHADWRTLFATSEVIHIAAHGVRDRLLPARSQIVLSDKLDRERITPGDIAQLDLRQLRLAILNACDSGYVQRSDSFSDTGFRRILQEKGVPAVIDAGWRISDRSAVNFARNFYRTLRDSRSLETSYRWAVEQMKRRDEDMAEWAAYSLSISHPNLLRDTRH